MLSVLAKSIREYKKPSLLAPLLVSGEVVMECIIPFVTANLVNQIKAGCSIGVIVQYGAVLVVMAAASRAICARTCSIKYRIILSRTSTSFRCPAL